MTNPAQTIGAILNDPFIVKTSSQAKQLHAQIVKLHARGNRFRDFTTLLLSIYSNFNLLQESRLLFKTFHSPPPTKAWKSIIKCCASNGNLTESVALFNKMRESGKSPGRNVFPSVLKTCSHLKDLKFGEALHGCIIRLGLDNDLFTGNALMNLYAKLEPLDARNVFDGCSQPNKMSGFDKEFNSVCFVEPFEDNGRDKLANKSNVIGAAGSLNQDFGREDKSVDRESVLINTGNNGLEFHCKETGGTCGLKKRRTKAAFLASSVTKFFERMPNRDVVSWNTVIGGYTQNGMYEEALSAIRNMTSENLKPDSFTLSSVLPIFARYINVMKGKEIHGYAIRHGFDNDVFIGSSLIDMYANCTKLEDSSRVFYLSLKKDSVLWNSIIAGCVQNGSFDEGLRLFREMLMANIKPVAVSFSSIMPACAHLTTVRLGKQLHCYIIRHDFDENIYIASSLIDMYAKCGNLKISRSIFDNMGIQDTISWTSMIMAYAVHGHAQESISFFEKMEINGVKPTHASFLGVLTACSHAGLVDEAWKYFNSMTQNYAISPQIEHYAAVADLLGRAGKLKEAYDFISSMHIKPTGVIWSTLLSACRVHKNVELAEKVAKEMFLVDPDYTGTYLLLNDVYVAAGRWKDAAKLRKSMRKKGVAKTAACSWIEVRNKIHVFVAGDENHPEYFRINEALQHLMEKMELEECVPGYQCVTE